MPFIMGGAAVVGTGAQLYLGSKARKEQQAAFDNAMAQQQAQIAQAIKDLEAVGIPSIEAQQIAITQFAPELVGLEEYQALGPSAMEKITPDQALAGKQRLALERLSQISEEGITPIEKAQLDTMLSQVSAEEQAREKAIQRSMAERGMAGSGQELVARLLSSQSAAQRGAEGTRNLAATTYQRALDALSQSGQMAGQLRGQEFQEQSTKASAADVIARFNAEQRAEIAKRNLERQQASEDLRNQIAREQEQYNKQLIQQDYQNRLAKAQSMASARTGGAQIMSGLYEKQLGMAGQKYSDMAQGIGTLSEAAMKYGASNPSGGSSSSTGTAKPNTNYSTNYNPQTSSSRTMA